jgi:hypothetical protein
MTFELSIQSALFQMCSMYSDTTNVHYDSGARKMAGNTEEERK